MPQNLPTTFTPIATCLNCEHELEPVANYCLSCGSKIQEKRLSFRRVLNELSQNIFNLDASIFKTFIDLFVRPETVIGGYLAGLRKRYLNAFSYMAVTILISGLQNIIIKKFFPNLLDEITPDVASRAAVEYAFENSALVLYATIPLLALIAWLVFYTSRKHNYMEQAIVQMYTYSHITLAITIIGTVWLLFGFDYNWISYGSLLAYIVYNIFVYKRLYNLTYSGITLRTLLFFGILLLAAILLIIVGIIIGIIMAATNPEWAEQFIPKQ